MTESEAPRLSRLDQLPGSVSVLVVLKVAADFSIDLGHHDRMRTFDYGYVHV